MRLQIFVINAGKVEYKFFCCEIVRHCCLEIEAICGKWNLIFETLKTQSIAFTKEEGFIEC